MPRDGARKRGASRPARPPVPAAPSRRRREWVVASTLALAALVVYGTVLEHSFLNYDDDVYITRNAALRLGLGGEGLRWAFTTTHGANWFPLTWLTWLADYQTFGLSAPAFLGVNVLLHAASTVALFLVFNRLTGAPGRSAFVAGVFGLHPLHVESVAWASARKDALSGLLFVGVLAAYAAYARAPSVGRYVLVAGALALGLMAKPTLVSVPFVLLLLDLWPLRRLQDESGAWVLPRLRRAVVEKVPLLMLAAASSAVTYLVQRAGGAVEAGEVFSLRARVVNALVSYVVYLRQAVWPRGLAVFYPHAGDTLPVAAGLGAFVALALATALLLRAWRARPELLVGWLWYLGMLVPVIGLVQVGQQAHADRYTYLPLVGVAIVAAWGLAGPLGRRGERIPVAAGMVAVMALGALAFVQVQVWRDSRTLFAHALRVTGENAVARLNLGLALLDGGQLDEAEEHLREAVRLHPASAEGHGALGEVLARRGRVQEARDAFATALRLDPSLSRVHNGYARLLAEQGEPGQAMVHLREAIALDPAYAEPYNNLGAIRLAEGAHGEAIEYFRQAVALDPAYAEAHRNWGLALSRTRDFQGAAARLNEALARRPDDGLAHAGLGLALAHDGRLDEALPHFERAAALRPQDAETLTSWGMALDGLGRTEEAVARYRAAVALEPGYAEAHNALGIALGNLGRLAEAGAEFRQAVGLRPELAPAWNNWGLVLARQNQVSEAIARFREAAKRDASYADAHNNLGVFLAQQGRYDEAREALARAVRADPGHADARANLERLQRSKSLKPTDPIR